MGRELGRESGNITVIGEGQLRAGCVYALGRNFVEHAREMGVAADPVVFIKPASCLLTGGGDITCPVGSDLVHHEVELVLLLGSGGSDLGLAEAEAAIRAVAIGLDLTARDLQGAAKKKGAPWARSKGFPGAGPVSEFLPRRDIRVPWEEVDLSLTVDGALRQQGRCDAMLLDPPHAVAAISRFFALQADDLIFTGTPAGVGPMEPGALACASSQALGLELHATLRSTQSPAP